VPQGEAGQTVNGGPHDRSILSVMHTTRHNQSGLSPPERLGTNDSVRCEAAHDRPYGASFNGRPVPRRRPRPNSRETTNGIAHHQDRIRVERFVGQNQPQSGIADRDRAPSRPPKVNLALKGSLIVRTSVESPSSAGTQPPPANRRRSPRRAAGHPVSNRAATTARSKSKVASSPARPGNLIGRVNTSPKTADGNFGAG